MQLLIESFIRNAIQILLMGAREALEFLDMLRSDGIPTRRTVRKYVMAALYEGMEVRKGTPAYDAFKRSLRKEVSSLLPTAGNRNEAEVSPAAVHYLKEILFSATGGESALPLAYIPFDGFTRDTYEEVSNLLGKHGCRYLGISGPLESLKPDRRYVRAMLLDELDADSKEQCKPPETDDPFELPFPGEDWKPHQPELEAFLASEKRSKAACTYQKQ
jgi:hypothetical protein